MTDKKKRKDWAHIILNNLYENYSGFDVYINDLLETKLEIPKDNGNLGRKVVRTLNELWDKKLITWRSSDHQGVDKLLNPDFHDNESITLKDVQFHARLTFTGLVYIGDQVKSKKQERLTLASVISSALATIFIIVTTVNSCSDKTTNEITGVRTEMRNVTDRLDSLVKVQQNINHSLEKIVEEIKSKDKEGIKN